MKRKAMTRLQRLRFFTLLFMAILFSGNPAAAYEEDTHFLMTYVMLKSVGFTHEEALLIAAVDQGMDDSRGVVAPGGFTTLTNIPEESLWHALDKWGSSITGLSYPDKIFTRATELFNRALSQKDYRNKLVYLGVFFHFQQDIWAHRNHLDSKHLIPHDYTTYKTPQGHAFAYKQPDRPPFDPVCALMCLEEGVQYAVRFLKTALYREPNCMFDNFQPTGGSVDDGWTSAKRSVYFNQLKIPVQEMTNDVSYYLKTLINAQINQYKSGTDIYYGGYKTADAADFNSVRTALQNVCNKYRFAFGPFFIPTIDDKIEQGFYSLTTPLLNAGLPDNIPVPVNVAAFKIARQSTELPSNTAQASMAVDGNILSAATTTQGIRQWWEVDLGAVYNVSKIRIYNLPVNNGTRLGSITFLCAGEKIDDNTWKPSNPSGYFDTNLVFRGETFLDYSFLNDKQQPATYRTRYVRVFPDVQANAVFALPEVRVYGTPADPDVVNAANIDSLQYGTEMEQTGMVYKVNDKLWWQKANDQSGLHECYLEYKRDDSAVYLKRYDGRTNYEIRINVAAQRIYFLEYPMNDPPITTVYVLKMINRRRQHL